MSHSNEEEPQPERSLEDCTEIQSSERLRARRRRHATLRDRLRKDLDHSNITKNTRRPVMQPERSGQMRIASASEKSLEPATTGTTKPDWPGAEAQLVTQPTQSAEHSPSSEMVASDSMNLIDESAKHMLGLMKGLTSNRPEPEVRAYDPEVVNAACNCAKQVYSLMRLKLDVLKLKHEIEDK